ncbi:MAG: iron-siderophore ABC transporter substrate-binding protein [Deinococcota bacterium]
MAQDCESTFRSVEHALGSVCVAETPERVVVLDAMDNVLALGITPVGAANWIGTATGEQAAFPYYLDATTLVGIEWLGNNREPNLEKILGLQPDLILGRVNRHESIYEQLSAIAPTVLINQRGVGGWRGQFVAYGNALNQSEQVDSLLADYDARAAAIADQLAALENAPEVSLVRFDPERIVIYQKLIFAGSVLEDAGVTRPSHQDKEQRSEQISLEQVDLIDADILFTVSANPDESMLAELQQNPLWSQLRAVQTEQVYAVPFDVWIGGWTITGANLILDEIEQVILGR